MLKPGRYIDKLLPDEERWYAIDLARGETLKASASFIPPDREAAELSYGADIDAGHRHARLRHPGHPELVRGRRRRSSAAGTSTGSGSSRGRSASASRPTTAQPFSKPGRYYLKLKLEDA